jgi:hypothetical protein
MSMKRLSFVLLFLMFGSFLPTHPAAADPPFVSFPCYSGAQPPTGSLCLVVPVAYENGPNANQKRSLVTISFQGREMSAETTQTADQPAGANVAAFDVARLGAGLTDVVKIEVKRGGKKAERLVAITPNRATHTQYVPTITLGEAHELGHAQLWGTVSRLDDTTPLPNATVEVWQHGVRLAQTVTQPTADAITPTFELAPQAAWRNAPLVIKAIYKDKTHSVQFDWNGQQTYIPVVLGWDCQDVIPRGAGGDGLPEVFCLSGTGILNGKAVEGGQVSIEVGAQTIVTTTMSYRHLLTPSYVANLGPLLGGRQLTDTMRISIVYDGYVGTITRTLQQLHVDTRWGAEVHIPLMGERISGYGLAGGMVTTLAASGNSIYGATQGGMVVNRSGASGADAVWERLLGKTPDALPEPEVSSVASLGFFDNEDWLLASTAQGRLVFSTSSGRAWSVLGLTPQLGPITALAIVATTPQSQTLFLAGPDRILRARIAVHPERHSVEIALSDEIPVTAAPTALFAATPTMFYAGSGQGLERRVLPDLRPTTILTLPVTALDGTGAPSGGKTILVGTAQGLTAISEDGSPLWSSPMRVAIKDITHTADAIWAATETGIFRGTPDGPWDQITSSSTPAPAHSTVGLPDVFDIASNQGAMFAGGETGLYQSTDGGFSWSPLAGFPSRDTVRSVATYTGGMFVLTPSTLFRFAGGVWSSVAGLPSAALNGAIVRASSDGQSVLVGRSAAPDGSLYASVNNGINWQALSLGENQGVTAIAFVEPAQNGINAFIGSDGDGSFAWSASAPAAAPALPVYQDALGNQERISALTVDLSGPCQVFIGTFGSAARIASKPCDLGSGWTSGSALRDPRGDEVGMVQAIGVSKAKVIAATSEGVFAGTMASPWGLMGGIPLRPLAMHLPKSYESSHLIVLGGAQAGIALLNDTAPDLQVAMEAPMVARGGEIITYTVTVWNFGLLPAITGTINLSLPPEVALSPANQSLRLTQPLLRASEQHTFVVTGQITRSARPTLVFASASADPAPGERFQSNNSASARTLLDYRPGPDPAIILGGQPMALPNETTRLRLSLTNQGSSAITSPVSISLLMPAAVRLIAADIVPPPLAVQGNRITWIRNTLSLTEANSFLVPYQLPAGLPPSTVLTATAQIQPSGDDREYDNNSSRLGLSYVPDDPTVLVLTNRTRLRRLGPLDEFNTQLMRYLKLTGGIEVALDSEPCLPNGTTQLECEYAAFDKAILNLATSTPPAGEASLRRDALRHRQDINQEIAELINARLKAINVRADPAIYLLGGDGVIPAYAQADVTSADQSIDGEAAYSLALNKQDSLYHALGDNKYITDRPYQMIRPSMLRLGRQVGTPAQIAAALNAYNESGGFLDITTSLRAGRALSLTEDFQAQSCLVLVNARLSSADDCQRLSVSPAASLLNFDTAKSGIVNLSEHSSIENIGDLTSSTILSPELRLQATHLLLLLGCHTGLAPTPRPNDVPALMHALSARGLPAFGYTAFAYASQNVNTPAYAEQLNLYLLKYLTSNAGDTSLGGIQVDALKEYQNDIAAISDLEQEDPLSIKTLATLSLFAPPTYQVRIPEHKARPVPSIREVDSQAKRISLTFAYSPTISVDGTYFNVTANQGRSILLIAPGHTVQPAVELLLPANARSVVVRDGSYHEIAGFDPVIPRISPLDANPIYREPGYSGHPHDWSKLLTLTPTSDGRMRLTVAAGSWQQHGQVERLFDTLIVEVKFSQNSGGFLPEQPKPGAHICSQPNRQLTIDETGGAVQAVESISFVNGLVRVLPMGRQEKGWSLEHATQPEQPFLVQIYDGEGGAVIDSNAGHFYGVPESDRPCTK